MEQGSECRNFLYHFFCPLLGPPGLICFGFPKVFGSPGHDLHLSSITLNLLSPQFSFFVGLKCDLFVYCGN